VNGAQSMVRTFVDCGVDVCFANPGTSEMHFVAALDTVPEMRGVLSLFEGGATGAADGYARITGRPAAVLLHLGPGLGNGLANLHNARRARVPLVCVVGDHATYHKRFDAQLESDIETVTRNVSPWTRRAARPADAGADAADAVAVALGPPAQVATLILPADVSWSDGGVVARPRTALSPRTVPASTVDDVARLLRSGEPTALFLGGAALGERGLLAAARVAAETGVRVICETFPTRLSRGPGLPSFDRLAYLAEFAAMQLDGLRHLVLVDAKAPVSFFAYPGKASDLVPEGCSVLPFAGGGDDVVAALESLADAVDAAPASSLEGLQQQARPPRPSGALSGETVGQALGAVLPEGAIVSDEANTTGIFLPGPTAGAARHDWLTLTGGAIGQGLPVACGAALAAPDRPVISVESDGSALYTFQSLWTMAREQLNVTVILLNNRSYAILNMELNRVGAEQGGAKARGMLDLTQPDMDFVALATGMGVPAVRAGSAEELTAHLERCIAEPGPNLIEVVVPSIF
jgi:acetolactate synthase I/II/III large subunit